MSRSTYGARRSTRGLAASALALALFAFALAPQPAAASRACRFTDPNPNEGPAVTSVRAAGVGCTTARAVASSYARVFHKDEKFPHTARGARDETWRCKTKTTFEPDAVTRVRCTRGHERLVTMRVVS